MPAEIRIYFEGHTLLKSGFHEFFRELRHLAQKRRCRFDLVSCGSGEQARRDFEIARNANRSAWIAVLSDSEGPLRKMPRSSRGSAVFWMVEMMEAWFHADQGALEEFYGPGFQKSALRANPNVEEIPKKDLEKGLARATRKSRKGDYFRNKTSHGPKLLAVIDPCLVRRAAPNCDRLFQEVVRCLK